MSRRDYERDTFVMIRKLAELSVLRISTSIAWSDSTLVVIVQPYIREDTDHVVPRLLGTESWFR